MAKKKQNIEVEEKEAAQVVEEEKLERVEISKLEKEALASDLEQLYKSYDNGQNTWTSVTKKQVALGTVYSFVHSKDRDGKDVVVPLGDVEKSLKQFNVKDVDVDYHDEVKRIAEVGKKLLNNAKVDAAEAEKKAREEADLREREAAVEALNAEIAAKQTALEAAKPKQFDVAMSYVLDEFCKPLNRKSLKSLFNIAIYDPKLQKKLGEDVKAIDVAKLYEEKGVCEINDENVEAENVDKDKIIEYLRGRQDQIAEAMLIKYAGKNGLERKEAFKRQIEIEYSVLEVEAHNIEVMLGIAKKNGPEAEAAWIEADKKANEYYDNKLAAALEKMENREATIAKMEKDIEAMKAENADQAEIEAAEAKLAGEKSLLSQDAIEVSIYDKETVAKFVDNDTKEQQKAVERAAKLVAEKQNELEKIKDKQIKVLYGNCTEMAKINKRFDSSEKLKKFVNDNKVKIAAGVVVFVLAVTIGLAGHFGYKATHKSSNEQSSSGYSQNLEDENEELKKENEDLKNVVDEVRQKAAEEEAARIEAEKKAAEEEAARIEAEKKAAEEEAARIEAEKKAAEEEAARKAAEEAAREAEEQLEKYENNGNPVNASESTATADVTMNYNVDNENGDGYVNVNHVIDGENEVIETTQYNSDNEQIGETISEDVGEDEQEQNSGSASQLNGDEDEEEENSYRRR